MSKFVGFIIGFALITGLIGSFNWYIDPYGFFGRIPLGVYGDAYNPELKSVWVKSYPHEVTVMGTSKAVNIDPDDVDACRLFNASINGVRSEQVLHFIEHHQPNDKMFVYLLDFFTFRNDDKRRTDFGLLNADSLMSYVFSYDAFLKSINNIKQYRKGRDHRPIAVRKNGSKFHLPGEEARLKGQKHNYTRYLGIAEKHIFNDFTLSERRFDELARIRQLLRERSQDYLFVISPVSFPLENFFHRLGIHQEFLEFRKRVKEIEPDTIDLSIGQFSEAKYYFPSDPHHYLPSAGGKFMQKVLEEHGCGSRSDGRTQN